MTSPLSTRGPAPAFWDFRSGGQRRAEVVDDAVDLHEQRGVTHRLELEPTSGLDVHLPERTLRLTERRMCARWPSQRDFVHRARPVAVDTSIEHVVHVLANEVRERGQER